MIVGGKSHTFDSFECAIHKLAPNARFADVEYLGMASSRKARYSAVLIVLASITGFLRRKLGSPGQGGRGNGRRGSFGNLVTDQVNAPDPIPVKTRKQQRLSPVSR